MNYTTSKARSAQSFPKQPTSFDEAMELLNTNTFRLLINPDHHLMWETINILPETVYCMCYVPIYFRLKVPGYLRSNMDRHPSVFSVVHAPDSKRDGVGKGTNTHAARVMLAAPVR